MKPLEMQGFRARPDIAAACCVCRVTQADIDANRVIVSPAHVAHFADGDRSDCGHDATGNRWWWPA